MPAAAGRRGYAPGDKVLVRYDVAYEYHARVLLTRATARAVTEAGMSMPADAFELWWSLTSDGDIYPEALDVPPLTEAVHLGPTHRLERGRLGGGRYRTLTDFGPDRPAGEPSFSALARATEAAVMEENRLTTTATAPRRRIHGKTPATAAAAGASDGAVLEPPPAAATGKTWRVIASSGSTPGGTEVVAAGPWVRRGPYLLFLDTVKDEHLVLEEQTTDVLALEDAELDARVLSMEYTSDGIRHRSFRSAVGLLTETGWGHWPVAGPRTTLWCCRFILGTDGHPRARHTRWRRDAGLAPGDPGVGDHENAMRILEYCLTYDMLQAAELSMVEVMMRKAQLVELKYRDRVVNSTTQGTVEDDEHLYLGTGATRGQLMVCPALEEHVAAELHREAASAKERRLMREERGHAPHNPAEGGKGGGRKKN